MEFPLACWEVQSDWLGLRNAVSDFGKAGPVSSGALFLVSYVDLMWHLGQMLRAQ